MQGGGGVALRMSRIKILRTFLLTQKIIVKKKIIRLFVCAANLRMILFLSIVCVIGRLVEDDFKSELQKVGKVLEIHKGLPSYFFDVNTVSECKITYCLRGVQIV